VDVYVIRQARAVLAELHGRIVRAAVEYIVCIQYVAETQSEQVHVVQVGRFTGGLHAVAVVQPHAYHALHCVLCGQFISACGVQLLEW
jgi:hypothetical protein